MDVLLDLELVMAVIDFPWVDPCHKSPSVEVLDIWGHIIRNNDISNYVENT